MWNSQKGVGWVRASRNQTGAEVVEFALIAPVMILLFLFVIEVSFLGVDLSILSRASSAGVREAVRPMPVDIDPANWDPVQSAKDIARDNWKGLLESPTDTGSRTPVATVNPSSITPATTGLITVTVTYDYTPRLLSALNLTIDPLLSLSRSASMYRQPQISD